MKLRVTFLTVALVATRSLAWSNEAYIQKWDELPSYGLLAPETYEIKSAKRLIVLAVQATAVFKGNWWRSHGLLGASRLPQKPDENFYASLGYTSLFECYATNTNSKMECVANGSQVGLLVYGFKDSSSWVYQREHYLGAIGSELDSRFTFNESGNYGRILSPAPNHKSSMAIKNILPAAYSLYQKLKKEGFDDKTLGDAIGMALAFLDYDGISMFEITKDVFVLPSALQIYTDTANAVLQDMNKGTSFFSALSREMSARHLSKDDIIGMPENEDQLTALVKLIKRDLEDLERVSVSFQTKTPTTPKKK